MISERTKALLQASATILGGFMASTTQAHGNLLGGAVNDAYALLAEIERREKANAPTSKPVTREPAKCRCLDGEGCPIHGGKFAGDE